MTGFTSMSGNACDCVTGERVFPHEPVFDTGFANKKMMYRGGRTRFIKEDTIVWLAEQAGYSVTKRNAGDSKHAEVVDGADVSVGGAEAEAGKPKAGRKPTVKRSSDGATKD
jgi:hypothetical protein